MRTIDLVRRLRTGVITLLGPRLVRDERYGRTDLAARAFSRPVVGESGQTMPSPWQRILCVVDLDTDGNALSAAARCALRYATALAATHRARVTALQVTDVRVAFGLLNQEIVRVASDIHADLIVVGCDRRRDDESVWRIAETLRQGPCPALIIHPSGRAAVV